MRAQAKQVRHDEEEESAFVSMTDMTVGFLFIMMILLAFFASQIRDPDAVSKSEYDGMVDERDDWREKAESRAERIAALEAEMALLVQQAARLQTELDSLNAERDRLELMLDVAEKRTLELEDLLRQALDRVAQQDKEIAALVAERDGLALALEGSERRVLDLEEQIRQLLEQLAQKDTEIEMLREELASLRQVDPLEAYLARVALARREVLTRLRDAIRADFPDLQVELSEESDALQFQGEGLFASGSSNLTGPKGEIVARLAQRLDEVLPCFTLGPASRFDESCNRGFVMIEAVQIEGHTDNSGTDQVNRTLSAARANSTFFAMTGAAPGVMQHLNLKRQPVLSVAAYGPDRPVTTNETPEGRATNRRIDLRFIMVTPQDTDGIEVIRAALRDMVGQP